MKEELLKRQEELKKEFDELEQSRQRMFKEIKEIETRLIELTGAYAEIGRQIKEIEVKEQPKEENADTA